MQETQMIDLDEDLKVSFQIRGQKYTHVFRWPTLEDIHSVTEKSIAPMQLDTDGKLVPTELKTDPDILLWETCIINIDGYKETQSDWKDRVPYNHKRAIAKKIFQTKVLKTDTFENKNPTLSFEPSFDLERVYLIENIGTTKMYTGFLFRIPQEAAYLTFQKIKSLQQVKQVKGKTLIIPGNGTKELAGLFDELVEKCLGYVNINSVPAHHKVIAVTHLFKQLDQVVVELEGK